MDKTSGSKVAFVNDFLNHTIRIHKPHPQHEMKPYILSKIEKELEKEGLI